jgi:predicted enzyme related to lactoylglutathione lyase
MHKVGMIEIGVVVNDLGPMTVFYRDHLGLEVLGDLELPASTMRRFSRGDAVVKLVQFDEPRTIASPPGGMMGGATGYRYLSVLVPDVDETVLRWEAAGGRVAVSRADAPSGTRYAVLEDPEGNWVEVMQQRE